MNSLAQSDGRALRKCERLLKLVGAIEDGGRHTSDDLAELLQVTPRTIYRDIKFLRLQGWRIPGGAGFGYTFAGRPRAQDYRNNSTASEARL
ncbi:HTH domain-containing protein [Brucella pseudogrignonensis]|uniref:DNA-binding transcriptional regulator YafY n=1 Tax=Brucella pseudogrignonensis TaxID=419475 RepID=A0ABU1M5U8_9HYPH|nr:HTH domain-containing protein [Brucella pseudogrignonensis]MDR6431283.1 putative DNA-binding transcriptional regulator YafY [Brucella pseudogrignonensis]